MAASIDKFMRRLDRVERDLLDVATKPRLPYSSIDGGTLEVKDNLGQTQALVGAQFDGSVTVASVGGTPPPSPTIPYVTPAPGGLRLYWDGTYVDSSPTRMDFQRVTFHAVTDVDDFDPLDPAQIVGEIAIATGGEITASLPPVEHFIFAVAWTDAGKFSVESDPAFGTPLEVVDMEQFGALETDLATLNDTTLPALDTRLEAAEILTDGWKATGKTTIDGGKIETDSITAAAIAVGAVTASEIDTGAVTAIKIDAGAVTAAKIATDAVTAGKVDADAITTREIDTDAVTANEIKAGEIITEHIAAVGLDAATIKFGTMSGDRIEANTITSSQLHADAIDAKFTITGAKFRTAATGERLEIDTVSPRSQIRFYSGLAEETSPAQISASSVGGSVWIAAGRKSTEPAGTATSYVQVAPTTVFAYADDRIGLNTKTSSLLLDQRSAANGGQSHLSSNGKLRLSGSTVELFGEVDLPAAALNFKGSIGIGDRPGTQKLITSNGDARLGTVSAINMSTSSLTVGSVSMADTGWQAMGMINGWEAYDNGTWQPMVRKVAGIVYVRGLVKTGGASNVALAILPPGYRPGQYHMSSSVTSNMYHVRLDIDTGGAVFFGEGAGPYANVWCSITTSFPAA